MYFIRKDDRIVLRRAGNQRMTGGVVVGIGLFFIVGEILLTHGPGAFEPVYCIAGFGGLLVLVGLAVARQAGQPDFVHLEQPLLHVDGMDYDISVGIGCVVMTEIVRSPSPDNALSRSRRYLQLFVITADDHRPVVETARRLVETVPEETFDADVLPGDIPVAVTDELDDRSLAVLHRLLGVEGTELVFVGESPESAEMEFVQLAESIARRAESPLVDVHGESVDVVDADELGLSLIWRLANRADDIGDPGPAPSGLNHESTPEAEVVQWEPEDNPYSLIPGWFRESGDHQLEYNDQILRYDDSGSSGVDREIAIDEIMDIRCRRDLSTVGAQDYKNDTELAILTTRDRLVIELPEREAAWLEEQLRWWLARSV